jgi:hypothetical protein
MQSSRLSGKILGCIAFCGTILAFEGPQYLMPVDRDVAGSSDPDFHATAPDAEYRNFNFISDYETLCLFSCENQHPFVTSWVKGPVLRGTSFGDPWSEKVVAAPGIHLPNSTPVPLGLRGH